MTAGRAWALVAAGLALAVLLERAAFAGVHPTPGIAVAAALYAGSHVVRSLRMVVLLGSSATSLRAVVAAHLLTAPLAALVPLKLGELARLASFAASSRGAIHALGALWVERTFDALVLAALAAATALLFPDLAPTASTVAALAATFLAFTAVAIFVLPENVDAAKHFLILRYTSRESLGLVRGVHALGHALDVARAAVAGKVATLSLATALIWGLEGAALSAVAEGLGARSPGLLAVLSDAFRPLAETTPGLAEHLATHRALVLVVLLALAGAAAVARSVPAAAGQPAGAR